MGAPTPDAVSLVTMPSAGRQQIGMTPEGDGYFVHSQPSEGMGSAPSLARRASVDMTAGVEEGLRYAYRLGDGRDYPDPASRWQPEGVHRPSALFFPESYRWSDEGWRGVAREELVVYELHVGAFTPEGTFAAIIPRLPELQQLGVTAIELMPVAQFAGDRGWGYDGVYPYAVQESYGGPRALQQLVDAAHRAGLAVILDVVYNHLGPEGNYLEKFGPYFTDRYRTPWGKAVNYDGPDCDPVRQLVIDNACCWVRDFHLDGLRLDAVHAIYDLSPRHILADIQAAVQREAARGRRTVLVIAESNQNDVRLVRPAGRGGYGLDGVWNDDFHHSVHALLTGQRDGYYLDFGRPEQLAKALGEVFVYDGCYSPFRRRRHGTRVGKMDRSRFIVCVQNHDQVGNRARGDRFCTLVSPAAERLSCGLLLLSPCLPLLFMGEEYAERRPFPFFCSFGDAKIIEAVRRGRREEFASMAFRWKMEVPDPQDPETFAAAKLDWAWPDGSPQAQRRRLCADLLSARRGWPAMGDRRRTTARLWGGSGSADWQGQPLLLLLRRGGEDGLLAVANLSAEATDLPLAEVGGKELLLSTEDARYGGIRGDEQRREQILPHELLIFGRL
jgi:maltooligosyltrehalose trehalohydrolase